MNNRQKDFSETQTEAWPRQWRSVSGLKKIFLPVISSLVFN